MSSEMIPSVTVDGSRICIPILGSDQKCFLDWKEGEETKEFFKNSMRSENTLRWCSFKIWNSIDKIWNNTEEDEEDDFGTFCVYVYDVFCIVTDKKYHLICLGELDDFSDIENCVCLPFNRLNLLIFYKDYLVPFCDKNFFHG
jgi:hypothetical protein